MQAKHRAKIFKCIVSYKEKPRKKMAAENAASNKPAVPAIPVISQTHDLTTSNLVILEITEGHAWFKELESSQDATSKSKVKVAVKAQPTKNSSVSFVLKATEGPEDVVAPPIQDISLYSATRNFSIDLLSIILIRRTQQLVLGKSYQLKAYSPTINFILMSETQEGVTTTHSIQARRNGSSACKP